MERAKNPNLKRLVNTSLRAIPAALMALASVNTVFAEKGIDPVIDLKTHCMSDGRIGISLQAKGFQRFYGDTANLYLYAADLTLNKEYLLVGYENNPDTIRAGMNGGIGSIIGEGSISFQEGNTYAFSIRRGVKMEERQPGKPPLTQEAASAGISVYCGNPDTSQDYPRRPFI